MQEAPNPLLARAEEDPNLRFAPLGEQESQETLPGIFIDSRGFSTAIPERTSFGSVFTRFQSFTQGLADTEGDLGFGAAILSGAGWLAHNQNNIDRETFKLGINVNPDGSFLDRQNNKTIPAETAKGEDLLKILDPRIVSTLEAQQFNPELLNGKSIPEGANIVRSFINRARLDGNIDANTDSILEAFYGPIAEIGLSIVTDPLTVASLGSGAILRAGGRQAAKRVVSRQGARAAATGRNLRPGQVIQNKMDRFILSAAGRAQRNGGLISSVIDSQGTRAHIGLMQGVDAGVFSLVFDATAQTRENQMEQLYIDPEGGQWDLARSSFSALAGFGLGSLVGTLLLSGQARAGNARRARVLSNTDEPFDNTTKHTDRILRRPEDEFTPEDLTEDAARTMTEDHINAFNHADRNSIKRAIDATEELDEIEFGRFMATRPDYREILDFLGVPDDDLVVALANQRKLKVSSYEKGVKSGRIAPDSPKHSEHSQFLDIIDKKIELAQNPVKPKQGRLKTIKDNAAKLRDEYLEAVENGKSQEELARIQKALFAQSDKIEAFVQEVTGDLREDAAQALADFSRSLDAPRATRMTSDDQADVLSTLMDIGDLEFPLHTPNTTSRFLNNRGFSWLAGLGTRRHDTEQAARDSQTFGLLANMIAPLARTNASLRVGVDNVVSIAHLLNKNKRRNSEFLTEPVRKIYARAKGDRSKISRDIAEALRVAGDPENTFTDDDLVSDLAQAYRGLFDEMLRYGQEVGELGPGIDNFVHIVLNPVAANKHFDTLAESLSSRYKKSYKSTAPDAPLHRGALVQAGILKKTGILNDVFAVAPSGKSVTTRQQLDGVQFKDGQTALDVYDSVIDGVLDKQARNALDNRINPYEGKTVNEAVEDDRRAGKPTESPRSDLDRKIEQEFFLQKEIMDLGVVETNPIQVGLSYMFGAGSRIAKQDAVNRVTGRQDITFEGLLEVARRELSVNAKTVGKRRGVKALIESLEDAERDLAGKNIAVGEGETSTRALAANLRNVASVPVQSGIPIAMLSLEIPSSIIKTAFGGGIGVNRSMQAFFRAFTDAEFSREQLRASGFMMDHVTREHRRLADAGFADQAVEFTLMGDLKAPFRDVAETARGNRSPRTLQGSSSRGINTLTGVTQAASDFTRSISGEKFLTNRTRAALFYIHKQQAWEYMDKLSRLSQEQIQSGDIKAFRGAARRAGFGSKVNLADEFVNAGLSGDEFLLGARLLREAGVDDVQNDAQVTGALASIENVNDRKKARLAHDKLTDYAVDQTNNLIVNPSIWDRPSHANNPFIQLINTFLSYPRAFRSRRIRPLADQGMKELTFWSGFYLFAEMVNRNMQDMVFDGKSPQELAQKWEDDPDTMIYRSLTTVPFLGPYQNVLTSVFASAAGVEQGINVPGAPPVGIAKRSLDDMISVSRSAVSADEDFDIASLRRLSKMAPGFNFAPVQAAASIFQPEEEEQ